MSVALLAVLLVVPAVDADPRLPAVIGDHMVLQRDQPVPMWGWADPGEAITVRIEGTKIKGRVRAGTDGRWRVTLPPLAAGGPFQMAVHGKTSLRVDDVLVGEVWLCAGQSNMAFPLSASATAASDVPTAEHPALRFFVVPKRTALEPASDTRGVWQASTPETARAFSAAAYYFGTELQKSLAVPIGLLQASWSGTAGEEWIDPASSRSARFGATD